MLCPARSSHCFQRLYLQIPAAEAAQVRFQEEGGNGSRVETRGLNGEKRVWTKPLARRTLRV